MIFATIGLGRINKRKRNVKCKMKETYGLIYDNECVDLDGLEELEEESPPQEKSKGPPIQERKRKNQPQLQLTLFDLMSDTSNQEENEKEELIKHELKRGSGVERGKMRICHEYAKNPTLGDYAEFLKREYGWGGYSSREYSSDHNAKGMRLTLRDENTRKTLVEVNLKWNEVACYIADLIDDDEYLTADEKIEFENYQAQRYGSDEDRIKAIADWMVEHGTRYTWNGHYNHYNHGNNREFVKEHISEIQAELESRAEVEKVSYAEMDGFNVNFKPIYCRRFVKEFYEAEAKLRAMRSEKEMEM